MSKRRKIELPHNWRKQTSEMLTQQGVSISAQKVYDVMRGRCSDPVLHRKVKISVRKLAAKHQRYMTAKRLDNIVVCFFLSTILVSLTRI